MLFNSRCLGLLGLCPSLEKYALAYKNKQTLVDNEKTDAETVIKKITLKLQQAPDDETRLRIALKHLLMLSRLHSLLIVAKQKIKKMPITYDITKDGLYLEGLEKGEQKGLKTGEGIGVKKTDGK